MILHIYIIIILGMGQLGRYSYKCGKGQRAKGKGGRACVCVAKGKRTSVSRITGHPTACPMSAQMSFHSKVRPEINCHEPQRENLVPKTEEIYKRNNETNRIYISPVTGYWK